MLYSHVATVGIMQAAILILGGMRRRHEEIDWEKVA
jgi:hypothetical protein